MALAQRSTKMSEIGLAEPLSSFEWYWLNSCLLATDGVRGAIYLSEGRPRLLVRYDALELDSVALFDLLYLCGVQPRSADSIGLSSTSRSAMRRNARI